MGQNGKLDGFVAVILIVTVIGMPHDVPLIDGFVGLQRTEARSIKKYNIVVCNSPLLWSEKRKYIVWLQKLMYRKINGTYIYIYIL